MCKTPSDKVPSAVIHSLAIGPMGRHELLRGVVELGQHLDQLWQRARESDQRGDVSTGQALISTSVRSAPDPRVPVAS